MTKHGAGITAISYHLPAGRLTNVQLTADHPEWQADKIEDKTGIVERRIAGPQETAADLAIAAARRLFEVSEVKPKDIDFLIYCSQSPDYLLPTTACLIQQELGLPPSVGAFDMNLGCSGFIYGLGLSKGLIETGQANRVLLLTADTYTRYIHPDDRSVRTIFGDAGAATLIERVSLADGEAIGAFRYGTNGRGAGDLVVPASGMRSRVDSSEKKRLLTGGGFGGDWLYMNGPAVFTFTLSVVPKLVKDMLVATNLTLSDIDMVIPHQANAFMLEALRKRIQMPEQKFFVDVRYVGNTVSATIPIALVMAAQQARIKPRDRLLLLGFGVGLSWGGTILRWQEVVTGFSDAARG